MDCYHLICFVRFIFLWSVAIIRSTDGGSITWYEPRPVETITDTAVIRTVNRNLTNGFEEKMSWNFSLTADLSIVTVTLIFTSSAADSVGVAVATYLEQRKSISVPENFKNRFNASWIPNRITLTVFNVAAIDTGTFTCNVLVFTGSGTETWIRGIQVTLLVPPSITSTTESQAIKEGDTLTLSCTADGTPPVISYTWMRLSDNSTVSSNIRTLANISRQENGTYRCTADNGVGNPATKDVIVTVHFSPNITDISKNQTVNEGDTVVLNCTADGNPPPNNTWTRLSDSSVVTMPFNISGKQDEGFYRCTAVNGIGNPDRSDVFIYVQNYHPIDTNLTTNLTDNTVVINEPFNLMCSADANPPAHYRLYKGQTLLTTITDNQAVGIFPTSVGERITQVTYNCTPNNSFGDGPSDTVSVTFHFPPSATSPERRKTVLLGARFTFTCMADGNPPPSIRWYKGSEPSDIALSRGDTLEFTSTSLSDAGSYLCFVNNTLGNDSLSFELTVEEVRICRTAKLQGSSEFMVRFEIMHIECNVSVCEEAKRDILKKVSSLRIAGYECGKVSNCSCGSVIVDILLRFNQSVNENDVISTLKDAAKNGSFGQFTVDADSITLIDTGSTKKPSEPSEPTEAAEVCEEAFFKNKDCSMIAWRVALISIVGVALIALIAGAVAYWIHNKRKCRKDTRIAHDPECEEQRLQGDDPYAQANNGYADTGPRSANSTDKVAAAAIPDYAVVDKSAKKKKKKQDEEKPPEYAVVDKSTKKKKDEKLDYTYAEVDNSKKTSKKKPKPGEDVVYADLGDLARPQMTPVVTSPKTLPPIKQPDSYERTEYADITQFLKGDATLPKVENNQGTEMKPQDEKKDEAGAENKPKETPM